MHAALKSAYSTREGDAPMGVRPRYNRAWFVHRGHMIPDTGHCECEDLFLSSMPCSKAMMWARGRADVMPWTGRVHVSKSANWRPLGYEAPVSAEPYLLLHLYIRSQALGFGMHIARQQQLRTACRGSRTSSVDMQNRSVYDVNSEAEVRTCVLGVDKKR